MKGLAAQVDAFLGENSIFIIYNQIFNHAVLSRIKRDLFFIPIFCILFIELLFFCIFFFFKSNTKYIDSIIFELIRYIFYLILQFKMVLFGPVAFMKLANLDIPALSVY